MAFVVTAPSKAEEIKTSLEGVGYTVESRALEVSDEEMEGSESGSEEDDEDDSDSDASMGSR